MLQYIHSSLGMIGMSSWHVSALSRGTLSPGIQEWYILEILMLPDVMSRILTDISTLVLRLYSSHPSTDVVEP